MKIFSSVLLLASTVFPLLAQNSNSIPAHPKLVVGIVVDQMRWDFLYRYSDHYSSNGFMRLLAEGLSCENTHINYSPSVTACGHTCIYSGTVPAIHGITGNSWFDKTENKIVYCAGDSGEKTVGSASDAGKMSPRRLMTTMVTDELRLASNFKSKVIGIALKDRGAIFPAGHSANAAYFYDSSTGDWITSSYYTNALPEWVVHFNSQKMAESLLSSNWNTLLPTEQYSESHEDDAPFEEGFEGELKPVFPHKLGELFKPVSKVVASTPFGDTLTLKFAEAAIESEHLGSNAATDFLAISLSSTDLIGHKFGPNSVESEDCYLRLDLDIAEFLSYLDKTIGQGNYLLFLTADHGVAHIPAFEKRNRIPSGVVPSKLVSKELKRCLQIRFGDGEWILGFENMQLTFNNKLIAEKKIKRSEFKKVIRQFFDSCEGVSCVLDMENPKALQDSQKASILNGYFPTRCGDMWILLQPGWFMGTDKGTTHGVFYSYDTHIPLVWMGWKIRHGEDHSDVHMTDIAPTIAALLHIQEPNGCVGKTIETVFH